LKREYRLIKLRTETVHDLKQLKERMGKGSLDDLIGSMIGLMDTHRQGLKEIGWHIDERGERSDAHTGAALG
jgi:hypothetical protein